MKRKVMLTAWNLHRKIGAPFADCLRLAWKIVKCELVGEVVVTRDGKYGDIQVYTECKNDGDVLYHYSFRMFHELHVNQAVEYAQLLADTFCLEVDVYPLVTKLLKKNAKKKVA